MRPLRIKASAYPVDSSNLQGLQEMTDTEIEQYYSAILTKTLQIIMTEQELVRLILMVQGLLLELQQIQKEMTQ